MPPRPQPTARYERFYVVTNDLIHGIWQAREEECPALLETHPGFRILQSFSTREEAEGFLRNVRGKR